MSQGIRISKVMRDNVGTLAIKYGRIAALISLACILTFQSLGLHLATVFTTISNALV
jgi:pilus assembly protein Flp/PilA